VHFEEYIMMKITVLMLLCVCFQNISAHQLDTITDNRDGQKYQVVEIGEQWWMTQNLNYYTSEGSRYYNDDSIKYASLYGRLYDWKTAIASCPAGWHVPTHKEWRIMEMVLGFELNEPVHDNNFYGTDEGGKLKEAGTEHWLSPNTGATNSTGFTALPGGHCYNNQFFGGSETAHFWAGDKNTGIGAWYRSLANNASAIHIFYQEGGYKSVRCLKDTVTTGIRAPKQHEIKVYPNPVKDKFTLIFGTIPIQDAVTEIYSIEGKKILTKFFYNETTATIDLSGFSGGMYVIKVITNKDHFVEKVIKE
jgi:uncharacterized protein (TIGR02145 family)